MNNALNGVAMNLEVVRLRARPGADAGAAAPFAAAAVAEHEALAALVGAAVALGRSSRAGRASVRDGVRAVAALLGPTLRHRGVTLEVELGDADASTAAAADAVTLAACAAIEAAAAVLTDGSPPAAIGAPATEPGGAVRCRVTAGSAPALTVTPWPGAWPAGVVVALAEAGVRVADDSVDGSPAARLNFPPP